MLIFARFNGREFARERLNCVKVAFLGNAWVRSLRASLKLSFFLDRIVCLIVRVSVIAIGEISFPL